MISYPRRVALTLVGVVTSLTTLIGAVTSPAVAAVALMLGGLTAVALFIIWESQDARVLVERPVTPLAPRPSRPFSWDIFKQESVVADVTTDIADAWVRYVEGNSDFKGRLEVASTPERQEAFFVFRAGYLIARDRYYGP